ncbi:hypothetical protein DFH09DRAFT_1315187 [Mycena vulgaris]|nr:hypothetical protein DFH09DRAFT_1315187 [Mycena vulgaris]
MSWTAWQNCLNLRQAKCGGGPVLRITPCHRLVALVKFEYRRGIYAEIPSASSALTSIAGSAEGAQAAVNADVLDHVAELLGSPYPDIQRFTCNLMTELASYVRTNPSARDNYYECFSALGVALIRG